MIALKELMPAEEKSFLRGHFLQFAGYLFQGTDIYLDNQSLPSYVEEK